MKKLFGGIDLTWKKLIIFAILAGVYTAAMAIIPITKDTSFRDISITFEWWILFGILIICNSKSNLDSALKCFVFFLISQPLVYLLQVPFSWLGWQIFDYYRYWFIWTLACLPMGYIGYYIKKNNILSMIILLPMLCWLAYQGISYFGASLDNFPHHLLSFIFCIASIVVITLNVFDKKNLKVITLSIVAIFIAALVVIEGGLFSNKYETYKTLDSLDINFVGDIRITSYSGTKKGNVEVVTSNEEFHTIKVSGEQNGEYRFTIKDDSNKEYRFKYSYNDETKSVELEKVD